MSILISSFSYIVRQTAAKQQEFVSETPDAKSVVPTKYERLVERARLRKLSKSIPIVQHDIDLIEEYIGILEEEEVEFDLLPVYKKLAYEVSLQAALPAKYWAEKYLALVSCAKGPNHPDTIGFDRKCHLGDGMFVEL